MAAGAVVADVYLTHTRLADSFGPLGIIAAYGVAVAVAMLIAVPISGGHLNPAITIAAYISKRLPAQDAAAYVAAQLVGAVLAAFVLRGLAPKAAFDFASGGVPGLGQGISVLKGAGIEVVLSFFLVFTFWAVCLDHRGPRALAPLAVGLAVALGGLAGAAFTGAAMNPARWFGPALAAPHFANWLVWVAGPLLGALLGSLAYEGIFLVGPAAGDEGGDEDEEDDEEEEEPPTWRTPATVGPPLPELESALPAAAPPPAPPAEAPPPPAPVAPAEAPPPPEAPPAPELPAS